MGNGRCRFDLVAVTVLGDPVVIEIRVPLRILLAKDCDNLMMAGCNVSVTHAALSAVRVMGTAALMGEAAGIAAAIGLERAHNFDEILPQDIVEIQQRLLANGCFLPNYSSTDEKDFARSAKISASSEISVEGVTPETPGFHNGLEIWRDQPQYGIERLEVRRGQLIATSGGRIENISLCLTNDSAAAETLEVKLYAAEHIWDYRAEPGVPLAVAKLMVPPGKNLWNLWMKWDLNLKLPGSIAPESFLRVDALPNKNLHWHAAQKIIPGHMAMYAISPKRMRRFGNGNTLGYRISPPQKLFAPAEVLSGVTRPHRATNLWISDPLQSLPQCLELSWAKPQNISEVQLVFPGHLVLEYHAYSPFYRDAQCPRDYALEIFVSGQWQCVLEVKDNYQRLRRHDFPAPVIAEKLRVVVTATNGDPSAAICEIRCH